MGEYTIAALAATVAVVALELLVLRTGLFKQARYWITVAIVLSFQVPADGWLTKQPGTVVHYDETFTSGIRAPWDIPVEDFGFGFALMTLTLSLWLWWQRRDQRAGRAPAAARDQASREASHA